MDLRLSGKRVLVTGASRGIGRAIAATFADEGCALAICARGEDALRRAAGELRAGGVTVHDEVVDVADGDALAAFVHSATDALGGLDVVVSNASAGGGLSGPEQWATSFQTDLLAFVRLAEAATDALTRSKGALVAVATTSASDTAPPSGPGSYGAIKAALIHHAAGLGRSLAPRGVRVNVVSPGPIEFPGGSWERRRDDKPDFYQSIRARIPVGRLGRPEEVAAAVAFLASPVASFCVGTNLVVDGGFLTRVAF
ncbi:MAG: SDR family oxidoreductase [Geodermatophilaceae bacterium]|nr:SDR family oxidoreductase [Geodermatophilaceae bacterium]